MLKKVFLFSFLILQSGFPLQASGNENIRLVPVATGWAKNSINAVIFRQNSVVSYNQNQYTAFYDSAGNVILGKRRLGDMDWEIQKTQDTGNVQDAHNCISIMVDGAGYLHMAWNHHNSPLQYCRSLHPESLEMSSPMPMTGTCEENVTYPQFYRLPNGNLIFLYRDGASGNGNLIIDLFDIHKQTWTNLHQNLIDGEGQRNAYWQAVVGGDGSLHLSWVWRETWDVSTNHDICYAKSLDGGKTWQKSTGEFYNLPITVESAEYAVRIPQNRELINQTSMGVNNAGQVGIVNYWRPDSSDVPQYHLVFFDGATWQVKRISNRHTPFSLSGGGTKRIPISRPQILMDDHNGFYMLFRDAEREDRVSLSICHDIHRNLWETADLTSFSVGQWEPTFDTELWKSPGELHVFVQQVGQGDSETVENIGAQGIYILEYQPE